MDKDELLTIQEVAKILRVDATTCRRWVANGTLEAITLPKSGKHNTYRIRRSVLDKILQGGKKS